MIRIDLGDEKGRTKSGTISKSIRLPKSIMGGKQIQLNLMALLVVGAAGVLSMLPYPFLMQFKASVERKHQARIAEMNSQITNIVRDMQGLGQYQEELNNYEKQKDSVSQRLGAVQALLNTRVVSVQLLDTIGQSLPIEAWLTKIKLSLASNAVEISGAAYSNEHISDLLDRLSTSVYLGKVSLVDVITQAESKVFQIKAEAAGTLKVQSAKNETQK